MPVVLITQELVETRIVLVGKGSDAAPGPRERLVVTADCGERLKFASTLWDLLPDLGSAKKRLRSVVPFFL